MGMISLSRRPLKHAELSDWSSRTMTSLHFVDTAHERSWSNRFLVVVDVRSFLVVCSVVGFPTPLVSAWSISEARMVPAKANASFFRSDVGSAAKRDSFMMNDGIMAVSLQQPVMRSKSGRVRRSFMP